MAWPRAERIGAYRTIGAPAPRRQSIGAGLPLPLAGRLHYSSRRTLCACPLIVGDLHVEHHGLFGTIWASLGMTAYYMALTWINILLGLFLTPLFLIPVTWLQDRKAKS